MAAIFGASRCSSPAGTSAVRQVFSLTLRRPQFAQLKEFRSAVPSVAFAPSQSRPANRRPLSAAASGADVSEAPEEQQDDSSAGPTQTVEFVLVRECCFGQAFYVAGGVPQLGAWDPTNALQMTWHEGHVWRASVAVPADCGDFEFKFVMMGKRGEVEWQPSSNHRASLAEAAAAAAGKDGAALFVALWGDEPLPPLPSSPPSSGDASPPSSSASQPSSSSSDSASVSSPSSDLTSHGSLPADEATPSEALGATASDVNDAAVVVAAAAAQHEGMSGILVEEETRDEGREEEKGRGNEESSEHGLLRPSTVASAAVRVEEKKSEYTNGAVSASGSSGHEDKQRGKAAKPASVAVGVAATVQKDAEWGMRVWMGLLGTWGRQTLMEEEGAKHPESQKRP